MKAHMKFIGMTIVFFSYGLFLCHQDAMARFGSNGIVTTSIGSGNDVANCVIQQPDGKLITVGKSNNGSNDEFALVRYNCNGTLDTGFGSGGKVTTPIGSGNAMANSVVLQPDGKLVVAGSSNGDFALVRYNNNGSLDTSFGTGGIVTTSTGGSADSASCVILQPDGKLVVAGSGGPAFIDFALVRYNNDGTLDTTFDSDGIVTTSFGTTNYEQAYSVILQSDGKLVAAGYSFDTAVSNSDFALVRYNNDGSRDISFGMDGKVITPIGSNTDYAYSLIQQKDGKLVVGGMASNGGPNYDFALVRYLSNGNLDFSFDSDGKVTTPIGTLDQFDGVYSLILQSDGKLVAAGGAFVSNEKFTIVRYNSNGSLDSSFDSDGIVTTPIGPHHAQANSLILQPDGKLVAAGWSGNGSINDFSLVRYNSNGTLDIQDDTPYMLNIQPDHALTGQTVTLDIQGWNLEDAIGVQLRNAGGSLNASNFTVNGSWIKAQFIFSASPGLYDLYIAKNGGVNKTFTNVFKLSTPLTHPVQWKVSDLGNTGNPIAGPSGIAIGAVDASNQEMLFVANSEAQLYTYKKNSTWEIATLPLDAGCSFQDVLLADENMDGVREIYSASSYPRIFQYQWTGSAWASNSFCAYTGPLTSGNLLGGGLKTLYSLSGNNLQQSIFYNQSWLDCTVGRGSSTMLCSVVGDVDNNGFNELYAANADCNLYQFRYSGNIWTLPKILFSGTDVMTCMVVSDLNYDGAYELYASNRDGKIYQFQWNGSAWTALTINPNSIVANKLAVGDADNDGVDELYAAGQNGHVYQLKPNGAIWKMTDLGSANTPMVAMVVGDGDNNNQFEIYTVGANAHVYQFQPIGATPTPTLTVAVIPDSDKRLRVLRSQINPLKNEHARVRWYQFSDTVTTIRIYNLVGDLIKILTDQATYQPYQVHELYWNGRDTNNQVVGSGIYIVSIQSGDYKASTKVAVIK